MPSQVQPESRAEIGTAFLVYKSADGAYLVTANHVIENAASILIRFAIAPDAPPSEARVVVVNEDLDLAVLLASRFPPDVESLPRIGQLLLGARRGLFEDAHRFLRRHRGPVRAHDFKTQIGPRRVDVCPAVKIGH